MRKLKMIAVSAAAVLLLARLVRSGEEPRSLVDKAIAAMGGEKNLMKHQAATWTEKGVYYGMGEAQPYMGSYAMQWPDQFRMEIKGVFTIVLNGDKGWMRANEQTNDMTPEQFKAQRDDLRAGWIASLLPLKNKTFKLESLAQAKVEDRPAEVVQVTRKDYPQVKLYFDAETSLPVKAEFRTQAPEQGFKEVKQETYFSDYRTVDGAKVPHKIVVKRDGKKFVEAEITGIEAKGKLPDSVFARPGS